MKIYHKEEGLLHLTTVQRTPRISEITTSLAIAEEVPKEHKQGVKAITDNEVYVTDDSTTAKDGIKKREFYEYFIEAGL